MNDTMVAEKTCARCKRKLPTTAFYKRLHTNNLDGLDSWCRGCNREAKRLQSRRMVRDEAYLEYHRQAQKKYESNNQEKIRAHRMAKRHREELLRSECEHCGNAKERLHMHHPDYSKPLEVITLCVDCHEIEHHGGVS